MERWFKDCGFHVPKLTLLEVWPLNVFLGDRVALDVIDVGGNVGLWCQAFMNVFGEQVHRYYAFEPLGGNRYIFEQRLSDDLIPYPEKVEVRKGCVGAQEGEVQIHFHDEVSALASVVLTEMDVGGRVVKNDKSEWQPQTTLDRFAKDEGLRRLSVVKVDVEGYEWEVLCGAEQLLSSGAIDLVYFEFGTHQGARKQSFEQFWDLLTGLGYLIYRQAVGRNFFGLQVIEAYEERLEDFTSQWMILASLTRHDDSRNRPCVIGKYRSPG